MKRTKKPMLWYVGLEALESRYTLQLTEWNTRVFDAMKTQYTVVKGTEITDKKITVGQVLDAMGRPYYAMSQIQELIVRIKNGDVQPDDVIFFEDMFHPGFEALPYMFSQMGWRPKIFVRCLAQTIDPDDFVHVTGMASWMRKFEGMVNECVDAVLIASHEMAAYMTAAGWKVPLIVTGLPFGKDEVRERALYTEPADYKAKKKDWMGRPLRVVFAARTDREKQPNFFLNLVREWKSTCKVPVEFAFVSGKELTSNDPAILRDIRDLQEIGHVSVYENLSKEDYYDILKRSRVLFNCALQDWVSNTVSEADALGCNVLYPAYRSFIEVFKSDPTRLYVPWSIMDAKAKLRRLLYAPHPFINDISDNQDDTICTSVTAMMHWRQKRPVHQQLMQRNVINPMDTEYRVLHNQRDWIGSIQPDTLGFWMDGKVTDKQLLNSYRKAV